MDTPAMSPSTPSPAHATPTTNMTTNDHQDLHEAKAGGSSSFDIDAIGKGERLIPGGSAKIKELEVWYNSAVAQTGAPAGGKPGWWPF